MKRRMNEPQSLDRRDPVVAAFVAEWGLAGSPVAVKLTGENEESVNIQIYRLKKTLGSLVQFSVPRRVSDRGDWIAHGTIRA